MTSDHTNYQELAALAAGGHLSEDELSDLRAHTQTCAECSSVAGDLRELVHFGLPLAQSGLRQRIETMTSRPDPGATERFLRRASLEGIAFSPEVRVSNPPRRSNLGLVAAFGGALAALAVAYVAGANHYGSAPLQPSQQAAQLTPQSAAPAATLDQQQRARPAAVTAIADTRRNNSEPAPVDAVQLPTTSPKSLDEAEAQLKTQQRLLADTKAELAQLKQSHSTDQALLAAYHLQINDLSQQLKTAKANADNAQHQLLTASGDVRNVMGARQLHVVDVRDTDPNGKPGKAFGRIFLSEGKSLVFYAFDLDEATKNHAKETFQVWGQQPGKANSPRSLGVLNADGQTPGRWALKASDATALKGINAVFVTAEPQRGSKTPTGQRLLFAYLGEPNHP